MVVMETNRFKWPIFVTLHLLFTFIKLIYYFTCGFRSKSNCKWPLVGNGSDSSYPVHISYNKCPKQITSIFSISAADCAQSTALTREFNPNKPFSSPDSLYNNKNVKIGINVINYNDIKTELI